MNDDDDDVRGGGGGVFGLKKIEFKKKKRFSIGI